MIQGSIVTLTKGHMAMLLKVKTLEAISRPQQCCWFHWWPQQAIPHNKAQEVRLGSKIWKAPLVLTTSLARAQRQTATHSKISVSAQFQFEFIVPSSTKELLSDKEGDLNTTQAICCWKRSSVSPPRCPNSIAGTFTNFTPQQSLAHDRSHLPYLHFFYHYTWWKSNSYQLTWSRSPLFTPLFPQLSARRLPCLMPCSWAPPALCILSPQTMSGSNLEKLSALNAIVSVILTRLVICFKIFTCLQDHQLWNH